MALKFTSKYTPKFDNVNTLSLYEKERVGEFNDCTVRALASAFDISYKRAHTYLAKKYNRKNGEGVLFASILETMMGKRRKINGQRVKEIYKTHVHNRIKRNITITGGKLTKSFTKRALRACDLKVNELTMKLAHQKSYLTVNSFMKKKLKGTYIIIVKGHTFTIKDGVIFGNNIDAVKTGKRIWWVYQVY